MHDTKLVNLTRSLHNENELKMEIFDWVVDVKERDKKGHAHQTHPNIHTKKNMNSF